MTLGHLESTFIHDDGLHCILVDPGFVDNSLFSKSLLGRGSAALLGSLVFMDPVSKTNP